ncbi:hypothetical protein A2U01_0014001 [Trifolium medium]|uniref:Uncharacterized protein n=1 Tax=Trifolium medium TaxID=97028 RepID=A0A392N3H8_9FABA|nr:hypothetical protein [Trifolium medium]
MHINLVSARSLLGSPGELGRNNESMLQDHKRGRRHISTQNLKALGSTPPPSRTTALILLVGEFGGAREKQWTNAPGPQERETPHLHPKP